MPNKKKFVPFAGDPARDRPTKKQTREEIGAIRKSGIPDVDLRGSKSKTAVGQSFAGQKDRSRSSRAI